MVTWKDAPQSVTWSPLDMQTTEIQMLYEFSGKNQDTAPPREKPGFSIKWKRIRWRRNYRNIAANNSHRRKINPTIRQNCFDVSYRNNTPRCISNPTWATQKTMQAPLYQKMRTQQRKEKQRTTKKPEKKTRSKRYMKRHPQQTPPHECAHEHRLQHERFQGTVFHSRRVPQSKTECPWNCSRSLTEKQSLSWWRCRGGYGCWVDRCANLESLRPMYHQDRCVPQHQN